MDEPLLIIGACRSGKSLIAGMIKCIPDIQVHNGQVLLEDPGLMKKEIYVLNLDYPSYLANKLELLNLLNSLGQIKVIWVIRDPIQSVCSYIKNLHLSVTEAFQYWFDVNTILWYYCTSILEKNYVLAKYEDILMSSRIVERVFSLAKLIYNHQYRCYGDFDQPILNCSTFDKGRIDIERIAQYQTSEFCLDISSSYHNKQLLEFLGYKLSTLN